MPKPSNPRFGHQYYTPDINSEVQAVGASHVLLRNSPPGEQFEIAQKLYCHKFPEDDIKYGYLALKGTGKANFGAEIAGLDAKYCFKNQALRRHVMSAWYKHLNPAFADKAKARHLYDEVNKPDFWPGDIEYCSPTNKKKHSNGKLLDYELDRILKAMRPVLVKALCDQFEKLCSAEAQVVLKIPLAPHVQTSLHRDIPQRVKTPKLNQPTPQRKAQQETVVSQETGTSMNATSVLMPGSQLHQTSAPSEQLEMALLVQANTKIEDLSTINTVHMGSACEQLDEDSIPSSMVPTLVEQFHVDPQEVGQMKHYTDMDQATSHAMAQIQGCVQPKHGPDRHAFINQVCTFRNPVPERKIIEQPRPLTPNTPIFDSSEATNWQFTSSIVTEPQNYEWSNSVVMPDSEPNVPMDTSDTIMTTAMDHNYIASEPLMVANDNGASLFGESLGFDITASLTTDDISMEVERIAENFSIELSGAEMKLISYTDLCNVFDHCHN